LSTLTTMKGLAASTILALLAVATVSGHGHGVEVDDGSSTGSTRPSSCDMDRGEPVCLDKMASYTACLGPELAAKFSTAAAQCHFDAANREDSSEEESDEEDIVDASDEDGDSSEEVDTEEVVDASDRQRPGKGKGKGKKGKGKKGKGRKRAKGGKGGRRPGKGKGGKSASSSSAEEEDDVFDVVSFVRNDVEERTCVYRAMGWVCPESGQVNKEKMYEDISTSFTCNHEEENHFEFDWKSALVACEAVKFPMLCSLTERVQEDLDIAGFDVDLDVVIHRLSEEERRELGRIATPLGFFNCAMAAFHAGCKATVEDMLEGASSHHEEGR